MRRVSGASCVRQVEDVLAGVLLYACALELLELAGRTEPRRVEDVSEVGLVLGGLLPRGAEAALGVAQGLLLAGRVWEMGWC